MNQPDSSPNKEAAARTTVIRGTTCSAENISKGSIPAGHHATYSVAIPYSRTILNVGPTPVPFDSLYLFLPKKTSPDIPKIALQKPRNSLYSTIFHPKKT
jgi:hypothetical protein